jgi:stearoyl-CoA desaturase (delta-9 desaturase)
MLFGFTDFSWKGDIVATLIMTHITIVCVTLYLHRNQSHQSIKLHPIMSHFFRFWLWLTTGIKTKEWVSIHRKHHAKCETVEDPHSPVNWGLKVMLLRGAMVYRTGKTKDTLNTYGHGTPNDWIEQHLYSRYDKLGIILMLLLDLLFFGLPGSIIWVIQMFWIPFWAAGVINGVGHCFGYRNFEPKDASTNIFPIGFFIGGEELHNNHHTFPLSAKLSVKWWEFDIGWLYIKVLTFFKLAEVNRTWNALSQDPLKANLDMDIVKLIINNRLQIMAEYCNKVIIPTWKKERQNNPHNPLLEFDNNKSLLTCSEYFLNENKRKMMAMILENNDVMDKVYQSKLSLQKVWESKVSNPEEMLVTLKKWIEDARQSGNYWLEKFAESIPHYTITP